MRKGYDRGTPYAAARPQGRRAAPGRTLIPAAPQAMPPARIDVTAMAAEVGRFFLDLRRAFRASRAQIAQRLATRIDIIAALEAGHVQALPPWPETCRIVRTYAQLARLDPRPALAALEILLGTAAHTPAPARRQSPSPRPRAPRPDLAAARERLRDAWEGRPGQALRMLIVVTIPVTLIFLVTQTAVLEAAVGKLPPSVARIVRGAQNYVIVQLAPVRDGLRWIDVPDPRTRRGDKQPAAAQPE